MKAVLDTNVLVSGLLSHAGPPARLLDAIETGLLIPVFSEPILFEYLDVLLRPKFQFEKESIAMLMESLYLSGILVDDPKIDFSEFNDPHDVPFLRCCNTGKQCFNYRKCKTFSCSRAS